MLCRRREKLERGIPSDRMYNTTSTTIAGGSALLLSYDTYICVYINYRVRSTLGD